MLLTGAGDATTGSHSLGGGALLPVIAHTVVQNFIAVNGFVVIIMSKDMWTMN